MVTTLEDQRPQSSLISTQRTMRHNSAHTFVLWEIHFRLGWVDNLAFEEEEMLDTYLSMFDEVLESRTRNAVKGRARRGAAAESVTHLQSFTVRMDP